MRWLLSDDLLARGLLLASIVNLPWVLGLLVLILWVQLGGVLGTTTPLQIWSTPFAIFLALAFLVMRVMIVPLFMLFVVFGNLAAGCMILVGAARWLARAMN